MNAEVIIGIVGLVVGVVVTLLTVRIQNRASRKLAQDSGDLDRPAIHLGFRNYELCTDGKERNVVCIALPTSYAEDVVGIFELPITVVNKGNKSLKNAVLSVQAPSDVLYYSKDLCLKASCGVFKERIKRTIASSGSLNHLAYQIDIIDPGVVINLVEPFRFRPWLEATFTGNVKTKDNVKMRYEIRVPIIFKCLIAVLGEDFEAVTAPFRFECLCASSIEEAKQRWFELSVDPKKRLPRTRVTFLLFEKDDIRKVDGQKVMVMKSDRIQAAQKTYWTN